MTLHRTIIRHLKDAGFELVRHGKHATWQKPDGRHGVAISKNIRDKNLARTLLRSVGIEAKL
jgi:hypothetical protein